MSSSSRKISPSSRWNELVDDLFTGSGKENHDAEWPHPDYAAAAKACASDRDAIEKLRRLSEDLETVIRLDPGPGTLYRVAGVPLDVLRPLQGRCWREVLLDFALKRPVWTGLRNYADALQGSAMDSGTRRTGAIIHALCVAHLEIQGDVETDAAKRKYNLSERRAIRKKLYLPTSLIAVLDKAPADG